MNAPPQYQNGLKQSILSPNETLAQSVAVIAPTAGPLLTVPLVFASTGQGTWLAFLISTIIIVLVALNINQFARLSSSPGSLYSYISAHMHPVWGLIAGWGLLIAYIGTGTALAAGLTNYINVAMKSVFGVEVTPLLIAAACVWLAGSLAYRDVAISTRLMLGLQIGSVALISVVVAGVLIGNGLHFDWAQVTLRGVTAQSLRMGLVLAIFSLVGFESATSLGSEAKDPLRSIPRAVKWSGILAGIFFVTCAYTEVLGFRGESGSLGDNLAPLHVLARKAGLPSVVGVAIDLGAVVSFFACLLACITAGARILFLMGQNGAAHSMLGEAHGTHRTPHRAVMATSAAVFLPIGILSLRGVGPMTIYGLTGTLATFGFLTAYMLVSAAAPIFLRAQCKLTATDTLISAIAVLAMAIAFLGSVYPSPPPPYSFLPYIYGGLVLAGVAWSLLLNSGTPAFTEPVSKTPLETEPGPIAGS